VDVYLDCCRILRFSSYCSILGVVTLSPRMKLQWRMKSCKLNRTTNMEVVLPWKRCDTIWSMENGFGLLASSRWGKLVGCRDPMSHTVVIRFLTCEWVFCLALVWFGFMHWLDFCELKYTQYGLIKFLACFVLFRII